MSTSFHYHYREFTPSEAAAATGVSTALQRDWRHPRRGVLPEREAGGWARFTLNDVIQMAVLKAFSDAGYAVSTVKDAASMATLPVSRELFKKVDAVEFDGDDVPDEWRQRLLDRAVVGGEGSFLAMTRDSQGSPHTARFSSLDSIEDWMADIDAITVTILDCSLLAEMICKRIQGPLIRIEVTNGDEDE